MSTTTRPSPALPAVQRDAWRRLWDRLLGPDEQPETAQEGTPAPTDLAAGGTGADQKVSDHDTE